MGPKQKGGGSKPKANAGEEVEESFQAVVLADTFEARFEPFTLDKPRVSPGSDARGKDRFYISWRSQRLTRWITLVSASIGQHSSHRIHS